MIWFGCLAAVFVQCERDQTLGRPTVHQQSKVANGPQTLPPLGVREWTAHEDWQHADVMFTGSLVSGVPGKIDNWPTVLAEHNSPEQLESLHISNTHACRLANLMPVSAGVDIAVTIDKPLTAEMLTCIVALQPSHLAITTKLERLPKPLDALVPQPAWAVGPEQLSLIPKQTRSLALANLTNLQPSQLTRLEKLKELRIGHVSEEFLPFLSTLVNAGKLTTLEVGVTHLHETLPALFSVGSLTDVTLRLQVQRAFGTSGHASAQQALFDPVINALAKNKGLTRLHLDGTPLSKAAVASIASLEKMRILVLNTQFDEGISASDSDFLPLTKLLALEQITIRSDKLPDALFEHLATRPNLKRLEFWLQNISPEKLSMLATSPSLHSLSLPWSDLGPTGLAALSSFKNLRYLSLRMSSLGTNQQALLGLAKLKKLQLLDMSNTSLQDDIGVRLVTAMPNLQHLDLGSTQIGDESVVAIASKRLRYLDVSDTNITPRAIARISKMQELRYLHLGRNPLLTTKDVAHLQSALTGIVYLYLP